MAAGHHQHHYHCCSYRAYCYRDFCKKLQMEKVELRFLFAEAKADELGDEFTVVSHGNSSQCTCVE
jgi:hypothetical protein